MNERKGRQGFKEKNTTWERRYLSKPKWKVEIVFLKPEARPCQSLREYIPLLQHSRKGMTVEMKTIHFELLEAILPAIPKHGYFKVTDLINKLDTIDAATKFLNESVYYDSTISRFLMTEGFAQNDASQDYVPPIIGQEYPHSSGTLYLTDGGRKLKTAGSYSAYQSDEARTAKCGSMRMAANILL